jgi:hypothetical protein
VKLNALLVSRTCEHRISLRDLPCPARNLKQVLWINGPWLENNRKQNGSKPLHDLSLGSATQRPLGTDRRQSKQATKSVPRHQTKAISKPTSTLNTRRLQKTMFDESYMHTKMYGGLTGLLPRQKHHTHVPTTERRLMALSHWTTLQ